MQLTSIVVRLLKRSHGRITMFEQQPTLQLLFEQLGLDSDDASIENLSERINCRLNRSYMRPLSGPKAKVIFKKSLGKR